MPRLLRLFVALLLCISLMPGLVELVENIEHIVHDGHLAHTADHETHDGHDHEDVAAHEVLEAEHGCTPMSHTCGCHSSVPVILTDALALDTPRRVVEEIAHSALIARMLQRANAPPVRPPIPA